VEFYKNQNYFQVSALKEHKAKSLEECQHIAPLLSEGWWEFAQLTDQLQREFLREFWIHALPYVPHIYRMIDDFFARVQKITIYLVQEKQGEAFKPLMVYQFESEYYAGGPPLCPREVSHFKQLISFPLPQDYLLFFQIHDGFAKGKEKGVFPLATLNEVYGRFQQEVSLLSEKLKIESQVVDPQDLLPFYSPAAKETYQCFYKDWYPDGEVGNICAFLEEQRLSTLKQGETSAFVSFLDWLSFYLQ